MFRGRHFAAGSVAILMQRAVRRGSFTGTHCTNRSTSEGSSLSSNTHVVSSSVWAGCQVSHVMLTEGAQCACANPRDDTESWRGLRGFCSCSCTLTSLTGGPVVPVAKAYLNSTPAAMLAPLATSSSRRCSCVQRCLSLSPGPGRPFCCCAPSKLGLHLARQFEFSSYRTILLGLRVKRLTCASNPSTQSPMSLLVLC